METFGRGGLAAEGDRRALGLAGNDGRLAHIGRHEDAGNSEVPEPWLAGDCWGTAPQAASLRVALEGLLLPALFAVLCDRGPTARGGLHTD